MKPLKKKLFDTKVVHPLLNLIYEIYPQIIKTLFVEHENRKTKMIEIPIKFLAHTY